MHLTTNPIRYLALYVVRVPCYVYVYLSNIQPDGRVGVCETISDAADFGFHSGVSSCSRRRRCWFRRPRICGNGGGNPLLPLGIDLTCRRHFRQQKRASVRPRVTGEAHTLPASPKPACGNETPVELRPSSPPRWHQSWSCRLDPAPPKSAPLMTWLIRAAHDRWERANTQKGDTLEILKYERWWVGAVLCQSEHSKAQKDIYGEWVGAVLYCASTYSNKVRTMVGGALMLSVLSVPLPLMPLVLGVVTATQLRSGLSANLPLPVRMCSRD